MKNIDLLHGRIMYSLCMLSLPIVLTSLMETAYSLIDMFWIGRLGSEAVAAVGVASMFTWFSSGLCTMPRMGGQIKIGHSIGADDEDEARRYLGAMLQLGIAFAAVFGAVIVLFAPAIIRLFNLNSDITNTYAVNYMRITCGLVIFTFLNRIFTASFNVYGNSRTPFIINTTGVVINVIADPLLIFGTGPFPELGVVGAAAATVFSQFIVFCIFLIEIHRTHPLYKNVRLTQIRQRTYYTTILRIGFPLSLQDMLFSFCSMIIAGFIAVYGDGAVAAQKIGTQIESITWMAADGFMAAINAFISQNYGARQYDRVKSGYRCIMTIVFIWGMICSLLLIIFPRPIFGIFLNDPEVVPIGVNYLRIIGLSELFMCAEITTSGAFGGLGNTVPPSVESIVFTFARIPLLFILTPFLGLNGIWWSISISSIVKGVVLVSWYLIYQRKACRITA